MSSLKKFLENLKELGRDQDSTGPTDRKVENVLGKIWDELAPVAAHGAHEMASALFNGNAFVMYPHHGKEGAEHEPGVGKDLPMAQEIEPSQELER